MAMSSREYHLPSPSKRKLLPSMAFETKKPTSNVFSSNQKLYNENNCASNKKIRVLSTQISTYQNRGG